MVEVFDQGVVLESVLKHSTIVLLSFISFLSTSYGTLD
jgi:hypothetical protein